MISHRHRCIYVKVPKCASSSVRAWFIAHGKGRATYPPYWYPGPLPYRMRWIARALELYPGYFTFTFVRDPHERFQSLYLDACRFAGYRAARIPEHPAGYGTPAEFSVLCTELLAETRGLWGKAAGAFLRDNASRRYGPLGIELRHLSFVFNHVRPQVDFLPDCNPERLFGIERRNRSPLGFIGTVETIDRDFARLQERLGLPRAPLPRLNASRRDSPPRRDAASRRFVEEIYAEDLAFIAGLPGAVSPPAAAALARPRMRTLAGRALFNVFAIEIGLEQRLNRMRAPRSMLAPFARLRRWNG